MAKNYLWIVIIIVTGFISFMIGYAVPPFMEVGFGKGQVVQGTVEDEEELLKQYQQMLEEEGGGESE